MGKYNGEAAAPTSSVMNSRHRIRSTGPRIAPYHTFVGNSALCITAKLAGQMGHSRHCRHLGISDLPKSGHSANPGFMSTRPSIILADFRV
jgi:hypothetical protein